MYLFYYIVSHNEFHIKSDTCYNSFKDNFKLLNNIHFKVLYKIFRYLFIKLIFVLQK